MNKKDLINRVSEYVNLPKKDVHLIVDSFLGEIIDALYHNQKVTLTNFGTFEKSAVKAFDIYSPYDGKLLKNVPQIRVHFKSSAHLKKRLLKD